MRNIILITMVLLCVASCGGIDESQFFRFDVFEITDDITPEPLHVTSIGKTGAELVNALIVDSMIVSMDNGGQELFYITDMDSGDLIGRYCKRGRSWEELLSSLPLQEVFYESGEAKTYVFSYVDSKFFLWNISRSLERQETVYERIFRFAPERKEDFFPIMSYYMVGSDRLLVNNSGQVPEKNYMVEPPVFEIYDLSLGTLTERIEMYNMVDIESDNPLYTSKSYFASRECVRPDKKKAVVAMVNFPQLNIIDLETGKVQGFRLKGKTKFSKNDRIWHFSPVCADNERIYVLYSGKEFDHADFNTSPDLLYVFDWDGNIIKKFDLDKNFTKMWIDNGNLYFNGYGNDELYVVPTGKI